MDKTLGQIAYERGGCGRFPHPWGSLPQALKGTWDAIAAAVAAAVKEEDAPHWLPIETAPKDGTRIMLARAGENEIGKDLGIWWACAGYWSKRHNNWNDGVEPSGLAKPSHWMPMPAIRASIKEVKS